MAIRTPAPAEPTKAYLRVPEAARRLGCRTGELYHWIDGGDVDARRDAKGMVVLPTAEVERLLRA